MAKIVSQLDSEGRFIGPVIADESPLETGVYLIPAGAVDMEPPAQKDGFYAVWDGAKFEYVQIPEPEPEPEPEPPTVEQIIAQYDAAVQAHLDAFARTRNYASILSACTYATSTVEKFRVEGQYCVEARGATWAKCYEILAAFEAGTIPMLTVKGLIAELPVLTWPN